MEEVILVDETDSVAGTMEKLEAHRKGLLHRAFSILVYNDKNEMLLQKRSSGKYHSGGLWTNACCSHPRPGEHTEGAAVRRLKEEMGIEISLEKKFSFIYRASLDNLLTEHELDHVFTGTFNGIPVPDPAEVEDWKWMSMEGINEEIGKNPGHFSEWFKIILKHQEVNL